MSVEPRRARYQQIADDLRAKILEGAYPLDTALPSTAQLMEYYDVSSAVVQRAITELKYEGVLEGQAGKGVFVLREPEPAKPSAAYSEIMAEIQALRSALDKSLAALNRRVTELEEDARARHADGR